jgi:hypothetical protein
LGRNFRVQALLDTLQAGTVEAFLKLLEQEVNKELPPDRKVKLSNGWLDD